MLKANLNNDSVTETTTTGYFARIKNAVIGVLIGIVLFFGAFAVLFWNEGRVNLSEIAKTSTLIEANAQASQDLNNKLVALTGDLTTTELIGDDLFLKPGKYLLLDRKAEMFAWEEDEDTKTQKNTGGSETKTTTYSYRTKWTTSPESSSSFKRQEGHYNPAKSIEDYTIQANKGTMGMYTINVKELNLPPAKELKLSPQLLLTSTPVSAEPKSEPTTNKTASTNADNKPVTITEENKQTTTTEETAKADTPVPTTPVSDITQPANKSVETSTSKPPILEGNYLFKGKGTLSNPEIGDMRISYYTINSGENGTVFGKLSGSSIEKYTNDEGNSLLCMRNGDRKEAIATLKKEHDTVTWIFRAVGFVMMLIGLNLIFAPIAVVLDILPFIGNISRTITGFIIFIVSVVLSIVTIFISIIVHNVVYLIITALILIIITALIVIGGVFIFQKIKKPA